MTYDGISFGHDEPTPPFDPMLIANKKCVAEGCDGYVARYYGDTVLYCSTKCRNREAKRRQRRRQRENA
jgi:phosphoribosyl 1,2-cyclic phosphodiesterase